MALRLAERELHPLGDRPGQIRMAAMVIVAPGQEAVGVGIAARADHVVDAGAVGVEPVPAERVMGDGRHRPEIRQGAPEPGAGRQMGRVERAGLAAEEALGEICRAPQVEVADLRALDAENAEKMPGRNVERAPLARRNDGLANLLHARARIVVERRVVSGQLVERIDDNGLRGATLSRVGRGRRGLGMTGGG